MPSLSAPASPLFPALRVESLTSALPRRAALAVGASLFVAVCAHLAAPLPFTPVPLTLGNLAVLLVGLMLGPVTAFSALALYLAEGAAGLPVFSPLGPGGVAQLLGPTGGYLMAYPLAAATTSFLARRLARRLPAFAAGLVACGTATAVVMLSGMLWLEFLHPMAWSTVGLLGLTPFLPGEAVKIVAAAGIFSALRRRFGQQARP